MPVRTLDGSNDRITVAIGSIGVFGGTTFAAILRKLTSSSGIVFYAGVTNISSGRWNLQFSANTPALQCAASVLLAPSITLPSSEGWALIAVSKASGTAPARFHEFDFGTGIWTHETTTGSIANSGVPSTSAFFGANPSGSSALGMDIRIAAFWNTILSDANVETLVTSEDAWAELSPTALWPFTQSSPATPLQDIVGASDQTAITETSVTDTEVPWTDVSLQRSKLRLAGEFVEPVMRIKMGGSFSEKPAKVKSGGSFI